MLNASKPVKSMKVPKALNQRFLALPISKSAAISAAIKQAAESPEKIPKALGWRMTQPYDSGDYVKTSMTRESEVEGMLQTLSQMTKLPVEQVLRLAMEAYINKL